MTPLADSPVRIVSAVTPLAADLTVHSGRGETLLEARVAALMEAIERTSAERAADWNVHFSDMEALSRDGARVVDPSHADLPASTSFTPSRAIGWLTGHDLLAGEAVHVARDLVASVPRDGVLTHVNNNGLAAALDLTDATVHALYELVERDALSQRWFRAIIGGQTGPVLSLDTLPPTARGLVERAESDGLEIEVELLPNDVSVPAFRAVVVDPAFPSGLARVERRFFGLGADLDTSRAVTRAITEALQSRLVFIQGARDSYNQGPRARSGASTIHLAFDAIASRRFDDLGAERDAIVEALARAGAPRVIVVDITDPTIGIPAVRAIVPGLAQTCVNQERVGWRCLRHALR